VPAPRPPTEAGGYLSWVNVMNASTAAGALAYRGAKALGRGVYYTGGKVFRNLDTWIWDDMFPEPVNNQEKQIVLRRKTPPPPKNCTAYKYFGTKWKEETPCPKTKRERRKIQLALHPDKNTGCRGKANAEFKKFESICEKEK